MDNTIVFHGDQQPLGRRFGKLPLKTILGMSDADFRAYVRNGDDPELYRLDDLEETVQALADRVGSGDYDAAEPKHIPTQTQIQPRGLDVVAR